jgi:SAM-dependent methyltransferase
MADFPRALLADLRCPCCRSALHAAKELDASPEGLRNAILRCDCYEYPLVDGIAVLRQMSPVSSNQNGAVERLHQGDAAGALTWLMGSGTAPGVPTSQPQDRAPRKSRLAAWLQRPSQSAAPPPDETDFFATLHARRPSGYAQYLFQRFANPSFLAAIAPLAVLGASCSAGPRRRILDLLCGIGHASATICALHPQLQLIMADVDFVNLFLARRFLAPGATAICLDSELPLPFADATVDGVFCLDGLHYVRSKVALLEEVDRIVAADGAYAFSHMHNADHANPNPGAPLSARGYAQRFAFGEQRLLPEAEILAQFHAGGFLDLTVQPAQEAIDASNALTLIGARDARLWRRHSGLDELVSRCANLLALNPLYRLRTAGTSMVAEAAWPSAGLEQECKGAMKYLPATVQLDQELLGQIAAARSGTALSTNVRQLLRNFVLVPLPQCYPRPSGTGITS